MASYFAIIASFQFFLTQRRKGAKTYKKVFAPLREEKITRLIEKKILRTSDHAVGRCMLLSFHHALAVARGDWLERITLMLMKSNTLTGYTLHSLDGEIGKVKEFYFDDQHWTVRYLVADTGSWLFDRLVLLSPYALAGVDPATEQITVNLSKKQIEDSPSWESDRPVSRQCEMDYNTYYGWPTYWNGPFMWGDYPSIVRAPYLARNSKVGYEASQEENLGDPHLRSSQSVLDHHVQASDSEIGHVEDFIIDDETWAIRYLVIDTRNLWPGKRVLIAPQWIERVSWVEAKVYVNLSHELIARAPEFTEESLHSRDYESELYRYYDRKGYWADDPSAGQHVHQEEDKVTKLSA